MTYLKVNLKDNKKAKEVIFNFADGGNLLNTVRGRTGRLVHAITKVCLVWDDTTFFVLESVVTPYKWVLSKTKNFPKYCDLYIFPNEGLFSTDRKITKQVLRLLNFPAVSLEATKVDFIEIEDENPDSVKGPVQFLNSFIILAIKDYWFHYKFMQVD